MLDIVVTITVLLALYRGWSKGIVAAVLSLLAVVLVAICSMKFSQVVAQYLLENELVNSKYVMPVAFIIIFILIMLVMRLLIKAIEGVLKFTMLNWVNRLAGAIVYAVFSLFFVSAFLWLVTKLNITSDSSLNRFTTYPVVKPIAPMIIEQGSQLLPYCQKLVEDIKAISNKAL